MAAHTVQPASGCQPENRHPPVPEKSFTRYPALPVPRAAAGTARPLLPARRQEYTSDTRLDSQRGQPHTWPVGTLAMTAMTRARSAVQRPACCPNGAACPPPAMKGPFLRLSRSVSDAEHFRGRYPVHIAQPAGQAPLRLPSGPVSDTAAHSLSGCYAAQPRLPVFLPHRLRNTAPAIVAAATISITCVAKPHVVSAAHCHRCQPAGSNRCRPAP